MRASIIPNRKDAGTSHKKTPAKIMFTGVSFCRTGDTSVNRISLMSSSKAIHRSIVTSSWAVVRNGRDYSRGRTAPVRPL